MSVDLDDLASFQVVQAKLQALFASAASKMETSVPENFSAAFAALLKLNSQLRSRQGNLRDERYDVAGQVVQNPRDVLADMDRTFELADLAYNEIPDKKSLKDALKELNFSLIRHDNATKAGYVAHYVAIDETEKLAVIGVKGTSSFEDMITDCCGQAVAHKLSSPFVKGGPDTIHCHEGIILAAKRLADDLEPLIRALVLPAGYKILLTGHSLGAGAAALCAVLLKSRIPALFQDRKGKLLRVVAFASPPVLDHDAAVACQPFITTVVNNSDIIPRASLSNVMITLEFVNAVSRKLEETGKNPCDWESTVAFLKALTDKDEDEMTGEPKMLMDIDEIRKEFNTVHDRVNLRDPDHLYCPGRVVHMYDLWSKTEETTTDDKHNHDSKGQTQAGANDNADAVDEDDKSDSVERVYVGDGTSKVLRYIEIDSRMVSDHLSESYRKSIQALQSFPEPPQQDHPFSWLSNIF